MKSNQITPWQGEYISASDQAMVTDSLGSAISAAGDPRRDKSASLYFNDVCVSDDQLMAAIESNWIARKVVAIPIQDATRRGRVITGEGGEKVRDLEIQHNLLGKVFEAGFAGRGLGGAAIYIGTDQEPTEPLDINAIKAGGLKYLTVLNRTEIQAGDIDRRVESEFYGKPAFYRIGDDGNSLVQQVLNSERQEQIRQIRDLDIHPSRLAIFNGDYRIEGFAGFRSGPVSGGYDMYQGWGIPVLKPVFDQIKHTTAGFQGVSTLLMEANIDAIGIPELMKRCGSEAGFAEVVKRLQLVAQSKGITGMLAMDSLETIDRNSANFSNLHNILNLFAVMCAAAADIPATRFLGQSPGGLQATGESDLVNYYDKINSLQTTWISPALRKLDQVLIQSALGRPSEDIKFEWVPLKQPTQKEAAETLKTEAEALKSLSDNTAVPLQSVHQKLKALGYLEETELDDFNAYLKAIETKPENEPTEEQF